MESKEKLPYCIEILKTINSDYNSYSISSNSSGIALFRGHENKDYFFQPSIQRDEKEGIDEHELYNYILKKHSEEFKGMKPIEILAKMQHMGVSTRLLDLTFSPLVADFFAVSSLGKKANSSSIDGEVLAFNVEKNELKDFDSDTVKGLSAIPMIKSVDKQQLYVDLLNDLLIQCASQRILSKVFRRFEYTIELKEKIRTALHVFCYAIELHKKGKPIGSSLRDALGSNYSDVHDSQEKDAIEIPFFSRESSGKNSEIRISFFLNYMDDSDNNLVLKIKTKMKNNDYTCPTRTVNDKQVFNIEPFLEPDEKVSDFLNENGNDSALVYCDTYYSDSLEQLYYCIQKYYIEYRRCVRPLDLINGSFVSPIVNTDRMRMQNGAFGLLGLFSNWNLLKYIKYLEKSNSLTANEIIDRIVKNQTDSSHDMENDLFGFIRMRIPAGKKEEVSKNLSFLKIDKETLGCGLDTTYYQFLTGYV